MHNFTKKRALSCCTESKTETEIELQLSIGTEMHLSYRLKLIERFYLFNLFKKYLLNIYFLNSHFLNKNYLLSFGK